MKSCDLLIFSDVPDVWLAPLTSSAQLQDWGASQGASCFKVDLFRQLDSAELAGCVSAKKPRLVVVDVHWELAQPALWTDPVFRARLEVVRAIAPDAALVVCLPGGRPCPYAQGHWLDLVDLVCLSGIACTGPVLSFLATGSLGHRDLYYTEAESSVTKLAVSLAPGQRCVTMGLEPWVCDMRCQACRLEPGCTRASLPWRAVGAPQVKVAELEACAHRLAAQGGGHINLVDQNIFSPGKLPVLEALHAAHPSVAWVLWANGGAMPVFAPERLSRAGVAGLQLFLPTMATDTLKQVAQTRAAMPDGFLELVAGFGAPTDTADSLAAWGSWAGEAFLSGLLDNFIAAPQSFPLATRVGVSGAYRFPFPGRTSAGGQPYWETEGFDSDALARCCELETARFRDGYGGKHVATLSRAQVLINEGVSLADLHQRREIDLDKLAQTRRDRYARLAQGVA